ncbi:MAG: cell wall anchor protein [Muribaculaceae bacterium]|nr:cell wall anchor protein [Muribaculaceae bacterium]
MKSIFKNISFLMAVMLAIFSIGTINAAPATLKVSMDSAYLLMGKATPIHIELVADRDTHGNLVIPTDSMCGGVEILKQLVADTTDLGNNRMELNGEILIQSFDSGTYQLKPILFIEGQETIASPRLALKVIPAMVDSLTTIHDYADVVDVNRRLVDYLPDFLADYGLWLIAIAVVLLAAWFVMRRFMKKNVAEEKIIIPSKPPYEAAREALMALRQQNLCEQGREKEYYTELTDILRNYLSRRFGINAMEMTSSQIRSILNSNETTRPSKRYVDQVLEIADFVKFAKMRPLPDDNVRAFNSALQFVEDTKPAPEPEATPEAKENTEGEVKPKNK